MFVHFTCWCRHSNKNTIGKIELSFQYIFEQFLALLSGRGAAVDIPTCNVLHWDSRCRMVSPSQRKALDLVFCSWSKVGVNLPRLMLEKRGKPVHRIGGSLFQQLLQCSAKEGVFTKAIFNLKSAMSLPPGQSRRLTVKSQKNLLRARSNVSVVDLPNNFLQPLFSFSTFASQKVGTT